MAITKIKVAADEKGRRLDHFLVEKFRDISRSQWQKRIKAGDVLVNEEKPAVHRFLKENDEIEITPPRSSPYSKGRKGRVKYKLVVEAKDYLIIEKPAGVLTHFDGREPGLADAVAKDYPEIKKIGDPERPGIVHRLDKDVSGLILIARTKIFFEYIKKQFAERKVKKIYFALVYGEILKDEDILEFAISRGSEGRMAARPRDEEGKEAKTHIKILERYKNYTFLEVQIFTGRTHQIRAHLLAYGHPVVGDKIYHSRRQKIKDPGCDRLFLHSHILGFADIDNKWVEYKSNLPKELNDCLKKL